MVRTGFGTDFFVPIKSESGKKPKNQGRKQEKSIKTEKTVQCVTTEKKI